MSDMIQGPELMAQTLWELWLAKVPDRRLDCQCVVYDLNESAYFRGRMEGYTQHEDEAYIWTPHGWFEAGFRPSPYLIFHLLKPLPPVYPPAEATYPLTVARVMLNEEVLKDRHFLAVGVRSGHYLMRSIVEQPDLAAQRAPNRDAAGCFRAAEINHPRWNSIDCNYEFLPAGFTPPPMPKPRLEQIMSGSMIEALATMPTDAVVRTQVWSLIKQPIPEDKKTFEEIKTWIEENYDPKPSGLFRAPPPDDPFSILAGPVLAAPIPLDENGFHVDVETRRRVYGSCRYNAIERGSSTYHVSREDIEQAAQNANGNFDNFATSIRRIIESAVADEPPEGTEEMDYDYHDHETGGSDAHSLSIQADAGAQALAWLRRYHPDLAEALDPGHMEDSEEDEPEEEENQ